MIYTKKKKNTEPPEQESRKSSLVTRRATIRAGTAKLEQQRERERQKEEREREEERERDTEGEREKERGGRESEAKRGREKENACVRESSCTGTYLSMHCILVFIHVHFKYVCHVLYFGNITMYFYHANKVSKLKMKLN